MRRKRHWETRVWHDPLVSPAGRRGSGESRQAADSEARSEPADSSGRGRQRRAEPARRNGARIVAGPRTATDPREIERQRLLQRLLVAEGRPSITAAANAYLEAGFELPSTQDVCLQLLEHLDESRVVDAIEQLGGLLDSEEPQRRAVLESRLRRIEEFADERATQRSATELRRVLVTKYAETLTPTPRP